ncbi:hypothetical protein ABT336_00195 [Micromonospora sp. NPDC000207]|uniref:hypothetical protein n=1 Tax=Micromonospora sp. NPDC000207 TaxID=3154246 RepID=UPI00332D25AD
MSSMVQQQFAVPLVALVQYDGTNAAEIADWVGIQLGEVDDLVMRLVIAHDETLMIPVGYWVMSSLPASERRVFGGVISDWELRQRYSMWTAPVVAPPGEPEPDPGMIEDQPEPTPDEPGEPDEDGGTGDEPPADPEPEGGPE